MLVRSLGGCWGGGGSVSGMVERTLKSEEGVECPGGGKVEQLLKS